MCYVQELKRLCNLYDNADSITRVEEKINLYSVMLRYDELKSYAKIEIDKLIDEFINFKNINGLRKLKNALYEIGFRLEDLFYTKQRLRNLYEIRSFLNFEEKINLYYAMLCYDELKSYAKLEINKEKRLQSFFKVFEPKEKNFYENGENVHVLNKCTVKAALRLIKEYGGVTTYFRPLEFKKYETFFNSLERHSFYAFCPKLLFSSVYEYAVKSIHREEITKRIAEEISDSEGLCITGCIGRLMNALRGFVDDRFRVDLDPYEEAKIRGFRSLSENVDLYGENVLSEIEIVVNNGVVNLPPHYALDILKAYTGEKWIIKDKIYSLVKK